MRYFTAILLALCLTCTGCATPARSQGAVAHRTQLVVYTGPGCLGRKKIAGFEQFLGRPADGIMTGMEYKSWKAQKASFAYGQKCWRGAPYRMVLWVPMLMNGGKLKAGARGDYDAHFKEIAERLVKEGHSDAYLRIGHEFNGSWYPWAAARDPASWKLYFRRIAAIFRETPGADFRIVWNPGLGTLRIAPDKVYPGDDVVDVVGADFYNRQTGPDDATPQARWIRYRIQPYGLDWLASFAREHKKAIAIPEWGTGTGKNGAAGDDPEFIRNMAQWFKDNDVLFHGYWDYGTGYNSKISTGQFPKSAAAFREAFGSPLGAGTARSRVEKP